MLDKIALALMLASSLASGPALADEPAQPQAKADPQAKEAASAPQTKEADAAPGISIEKSHKPAPCVIKPVMSDDELRACGARIPEDHR